MSSWIFIAILGHLFNAVTFIADKTLLHSTFRHSASYASMIGFLSIFIVLLAPFVDNWPPLEAIPAAALFGGLFVLGLWAMFEAMKEAEPSRVVPIIGSLMPFFTLMGTTTLLGEHFTRREEYGFLFLLVASIILTRQRSRHVENSRKPVIMAILAAALFAASNVAGKFAFSFGGDYMGVLIYSRLSAAIVSLLLGLLVWQARHELWENFFSGKEKPKQEHHVPFWIVYVAQASGVIGFFLVNYAISDGSAAIVSALQAVQYGTVVLVAWFGGNKLQKLLQEDKSPELLAAKGFAIGLIAIGLFLLARTHGIG
jgi:drug/metabolite transporter (DMT)-like permease